MITRRCPQCNAVIEFAQADYRICDNCGWRGDYTKLIDDYDNESLMQQILKEIKRERERQRQLALGGNTDLFDKDNTQNDWVAYICAFAGRAAEKVERNEREGCDYRENMIKVGALVVAAVESYDLLHQKVKRC